MANFSHHTACDNCGSSDANAVYDDGSTYCFSCNKSTQSSSSYIKKETGKVSNLYYQGEFMPLRDRGIDLDTAKFFKVKVDDKGNYIYPLYDKDGNVVSTKVRKAGAKEFKITGEFKKATLFGMQSFGTGGKYLTIVEGQDDAMAAYKMMGSKWPVVSIHSASSAESDIKANIDYIESFEKVIIVLDSDEAGRKASQKVAELLSPNKAYIVTLNKFKDANDYLKAGKSSDFYDEWWKPKQFTPAGIKSFDDLFDSFKDRVKTEIIPLPDFFGNTKAMFNGGLARGEITTIVGDTSIGKTTLVNNILLGLLQNPTTKVLYLGLETTTGELVGKMLSMSLGRNIDSVDKLTDDELDSLEQEFDKLDWTNRLKIVDHKGSIDPDELLQKLRNAIVAFECNVVFIDPLQQALPNSENDTVRVFMDNLLKLASQTKATFILTSHVRKRDTKNAHDITEDDALGSSAIKQVSYNLILASRDKLADSESQRSSIKMVVAKNRRCGKTGLGSWLLYDRDTLKLNEAPDPYLDGTSEEDVWK
jgi:twinkle protein